MFIFPIFHSCGNMTETVMSLSAFGFIKYMYKWFYVHVFNIHTAAKVSVRRDYI